VDLRASDGNLT